MIFKQYDYLPEEAVSIRTAVFMEEQGFCDEFDEADNGALHLVAYSGQDKPVAACRIMEGKDGAYLLGRLAVISGFRGKNVGSQMIREAEKIILAKGGRSVMLHAQYRVRAFYNKLGYSESGTPDEEEGCPHIWMKKEII